ncbi:MAG: DUF2141 domain-containing protein [Gammaproteobacteria bacterium]|nr:DUF2141 domain-containing protein [Gammaproteobacteria bacterium]
MGIANFWHEVQNKTIINFIKGTRAVTLVSLIFSGTALAADSSGTLSIQVHGFSHERGHAVANLFREGDDVLKPDKAYRREQAEIHDGSATINFPNLAYGKYAVSVFHDENGNGKLDHNVFRFPAESFGFSNNFHLGLFSGFPSFEKLQFPFSADTGVLEITLE